MTRVVARVRIVSLRRADLAPSIHAVAARCAVVARRPQQPFESFPPFAIIVGAITAMGGVQYLVHHAYEGKPKPTGADNFDRLLKYRDIRLKEEAKVRFRRGGRRADEAFANKGFFFRSVLPRPRHRTRRSALASFCLTSSPPQPHSQSGQPTL